MAVAALPTLGRVGAAGAQPPAQVPGELAAALLDAGQSLHPERPVVTAGRLPDAFPPGVVPAGARILGGAQWPSGASVAVLVSTDPPEAARARALATLEALGWRAAPSTPDPFAGEGPPRFLSSPVPDPDAENTRCAPAAVPASASASRPTLGIAVAARPRDPAPDGTAQAGALVRLVATPFGRGGRCRPSAPRRLVADPRPLGSAPRLPALRPPPGVRVVATGVTGADEDAFTTSARVFPDGDDRARPAPLDMRALLGHYADQLRAAGWTVVAPSSRPAARTPLFLSPADSGGLGGPPWSAPFPTAAPTAARPWSRA